MYMYYMYMYVCTCTHTGYMHVYILYVLRPQVSASGRYSCILVVFFVLFERVSSI